MEGFAENVSHGTAYGKKYNMSKMLFLRVFKAYDGAESE